MSKLYAAVVAALVVTLSFTAPVLASGKGSGGAQQGELRVEGSITAVNAAAGTVTIRTQSGASVTVTTNAATKIERNGVHATLAAFKIGDRGQARYAAGGLASKVEATGP